MRCWLGTVLAAAAIALAAMQSGCFGPDYSDQTRCSDDGRCPSGRSCSVSGFCVKDEPDGGPEVDGGDGGEVDGGPALQLLPAMNDFGTVVRGRASLPMVFTVTGADPLGAALMVRVSGTAAGSFVIATDGCSSMLVSPCSFEVVFQPLAEGTLMASVEVTQGAVQRGATLTGVAVPVGVLGIAPLTHDYAGVVLGMTANHDFTITNTGSVPTGALVVALGGSGKDQFELVAVAGDCTGVSLAAAATCTQRVAFKPTRTGVAQASLSIGSTPSGTAVASLSGRGVGPAEVQAMPAAIDFGTVTVGQNATAMLELRNVGGIATGIPVLTLMGGSAAEFMITTNGCTAAIMPGGMCMVTLRFTPQSPAGARMTNLVVNAPGAGALMVALMGASVPPGALSAAPSALALGSVPIGSDARMMVTITNTGGTPTGTLATNVTGSNAADFSITSNTCAGMVLQPTTTCTVQVRFFPALAGSKSASLTVTATPGGTVPIGLSGVGTTQLSVTQTGTGTGAVSGGGIISCPGTCSGQLASPSITLFASAGLSSSFSNWTGCDSVAGTQCTVMGNAAMRTVNAVFIQRTHPITVVISGTGRVVSMPGGIDCPGICTTSFPEGMNISLIAVPTAGAFQQWIGNECAGSGTNCNFQVSGPDTETAVFSGPCHMVINEVEMYSYYFVELYNPCPTSQLLTGWRLVYRNASNSNPAVPAYDDVEAGVLDGINMNPQSYAVVGNGFHVNWYQQPPLLTYGSFALRDSMGSIVDSMSFGGSQVDPDNAFTEGAPAPQQTGSHARIPNGFDSNNNSSDFQQRSQTWGNPNPP